MKIIKNVMKVVTLFFASIFMFWILVVGIPPERNLANLYFIFAIGFSIALPIYTYKSIKYIKYLQKRVRELEE